MDAKENIITERLIQQVAEGKENAFRQLFKKYEPVVYSVSLQLLGDSSKSRDICQDVFLSVWLNRHRLPAVNNFNAWLYTIARNRIYAMVKEKNKLPVLFIEGVPLDILPKGYNNTETALKVTEIKRVLHEAIALLPEKQKQVYLLIHEEGLSRKEVSAKMNVSAETIKTHAELALKKIRAYCLKHLEVDAYLALIVLFLEA